MLHISYGSAINMGAYKPWPLTTTIYKSICLFKRSLFALIQRCVSFNCLLIADVFSWKINLCMAALNAWLLNVISKLEWICVFGKVAHGKKYTHAFNSQKENQANVWLEIKAQTFGKFQSIQWCAQFVRRICIKDP